MVKTNKGNAKLDAMSEAELARYFEDRKGDVSQWEAKPAKIRIRRGGPSTLFSLRLTPEELAELREAAAGNVSDFIRTAALARARVQRTPAEREPAKVDAEELMRDLRDQLVAMRASLDRVERELETRIVPAP